MHITRSVWFTHNDWNVYLGKEYKGLGKIEQELQKEQRLHQDTEALNVKIRHLWISPLLYDLQDHWSDNTIGESQCYKIGTKLGHKDSGTFE